MSHTKGKLRVNGDEIYRLEDGTQVCFIEPVFPFEDRVGDARRLVACWNACEGIGTEMIESGANAMLEHSKSLARERDELLAVVRKLAEWSEKYPAHRTYSHHRINEIAGELEEINDTGLTVLAKYPKAKS